VVPATLAIAQGEAQDGLANQPVAVPPAVVVRGAAGQAAAGVTVIFAVTSGGGVALGDTVVTDGQGLAQVGGWVLGISPGTNTLMATVTGVDSVTFTATAKSSLFRIDVRFIAGTPTQTQRNAFTQAATRWATMVIGDQPDVSLNRAANSCHPALAETVDDLLIFVRLEPIDGQFGVLAQAGPCLVRTSNSLTVVGSMMVDTDDLTRIEQNGTLQAVVLHEMGHVLGVGSLWGSVGLLQDPSLPPATGTDPHFSGTQAIAEFDQAGGLGYAGAKVPVADMGGPGSQDSHWRESVLKNELMTPVINSGTNPLSRITVMSLADMGYTVNPAGADAFTLNLVVLRAGAVVEETLAGDVRSGPVYWVDDSGRVTGTLRTR